MNTESEHGADKRIPNDLMLSSLLLLISRYAAAVAEGDACVRLAVSIQCHLELLCERADVPALVRDTCGLLAEEWRAGMAHREGLPCRPELRALVRSARLR